MKKILVATFAALSLASAATASAQDVQAKLYAATITGDTAAVREAIKAGAKVNELDYGRSQNGRRPLNYAAIGNNVAIIKMLLAAGAGIDSVNLTGFTALHHAAEVGRLEAAQALLDAGANPLAKNVAGLTPAEIARERGNAAVAEAI